MYSYPPDAPRYKTVTQPVKKTSPTPQPLYRGEQPRSEAVSIVAPGCRNCGRDHSLKNCPYIDCPGTNTDHSVDWVASKAGHSWKYWGYPSFQIDRVLPGTEERKWLPLRDLKAKEKEDRMYKRSRYGGSSDDD